MGLKNFVFGIILFMGEHGSETAVVEEILKEGIYLFLGWRAV